MYQWCVFASCSWTHITFWVIKYPWLQSFWQSSKVMKLLNFNSMLAVKMDVRNSVGITESWNFSVYFPLEPWHKMPTYVLRWVYSAMLPSAKVCPYADQCGNFSFKSCTFKWVLCYFVNIFRHAAYVEYFKTWNKVSDGKYSLVLTLNYMVGFVIFNYTAIFMAISPVQTIFHFKAYITQFHLQ